MGEIMDKRIIRTKNSISDALLKLIEEKQATKITVSELAKEAKIERKTFYLHYSCIEDVYLELGKSIAKDIEDECEKIITNKDYMLTNLFLHLNNVINRNMHFFKGISKNDSYSFLLHSFEDSLSNAMRKIGEQMYNIKSPNLGLYANFYSAGIIKLCQLWLKGDTNLSQDEMTRIVSRACFLSLEELIKKQNA